MITFSRIDLSIAIFIFAILIIFVVLYKLEIFEMIEITKGLGIGLPLVILHQRIFTNNIIDLIVDQKKLLLTKSKEGLYLPYKMRDIIKSFMVLGVPILTFVTLIVGIILNKPIWIIAIAVLFYSMILFISLTFNKKKNPRVFKSFMKIIVFDVSSLLIGFFKKEERAKTSLQSSRDEKNGE